MTALGFPRTAPASAVSRAAAGSRHPPVRKVLFFGKSKSTSGTTRAIVDGLRSAGLTVRWLNCSLLRRWLREPLMRAFVRRVWDRFQPDLIFNFFRDIPPDLLAEFHPRCRTVMWWEEFVHPPSSELRPWLEHCDMLCLNNTIQDQSYLALGARRVEFVMSGYSPSVHRPAGGAGSRPGRDLVYMGSPGHENLRAEMLLKLAERYTVEVFGRGWEPFAGRSRNLRVHGPVKPRRFSRICAEARIVLGINQFNAVPHYFSNRTWMTLGSRGFHLTHYVPGLEEVFEDGRHLAWFRDLHELVDRIERYRGDETARQRIAAEGQAYVRACHTYGDRMRQMLDLLAREDALGEVEPARAGEPGAIASARLDPAPAAGRNGHAGQNGCAEPRTQNGARTAGVLGPAAGQDRARFVIRPGGAD